MQHQKTFATFRRLVVGVCLKIYTYVGAQKMKNLSSCWAKDMWLLMDLIEVPFQGCGMANQTRYYIYEPNFSTLTSHRDWYLKELKVQLVLVSGKYMTMIHLKNRTMMHLNKNSIHNYGIKVKINDIWFWAKTYNIN